MGEYNRVPSTRNVRGNSIATVLAAESVREQCETFVSNAHESCDPGGGFRNSVRARHGECDTYGRCPRARRGGCVGRAHEPWGTPAGRSSMVWFVFWRIRARVCSRATALVDDHFGQVPLDDVAVVREVYERHGRELDGRAARLEYGRVLGLPVVLDRLRVQVEVRVRCPVHATAVAAAVVGVVAAGRDYPRIPADLLELDVEPLLAALAAQRQRAVERAAAHAPGHRRVRVHHQERVLPLVGLPGVVEQHRRHQAAAPGTVDVEPQPVLARRTVPLAHRVRHVHRYPAQVVQRQRQRRRQRGVLVKLLWTRKRARAQMCTR